MFYKCSSLKELHLNSNFNINHKISTYRIYDGCSDELKRKIDNFYSNME